MESRYYSDNNLSEKSTISNNCEIPSVSNGGKRSRSVSKRMHSIAHEEGGGDSKSKGIFSSISDIVSQEMDEYGVVNKIYCCGNSAQREAKLTAGFDTFLALGALVGIGTVYVLLKYDGLTQERIIRVEGPNGDIQAFFDMPSETRLVSVSIVIAILIVRIGLGLMLFLGAAKKYTTLLLAWSTSTIALQLYAAVSATLGIVYFHNKLIIGVAIVVETLYKWYCLWIVTIVMKEIRLTKREVKREMEVSNVDSYTATAL